MKILSVVGARPNFMKIAPLVKAFDRHSRGLNEQSGVTSDGERAAGNVNFEHLLVHTGQHYDARMSAAFFDALDIPHPDIDLGIGSGSHAEQVGRTMMAFEKVVREQRPDWIVVVGDVNATCACSITAKKEHVRLAHIEAGLRSFDLDMPEEINRMVTDRLADLLFTTDQIASANLRREGVPDPAVKQVGNIMIDTLEAHRDAAARLDLTTVVRENLLEHPTGKELPAINPGSYAVLTMHRPSNVDDPAVLEPLVDFFVNSVADDMPLLWTLHPRTDKELIRLGLRERLAEAPNLVVLNPLGYHELLRLNMDAQVLFTDSGGLQEESCVLGTPCLTLRRNTERPITLRENGGVSVLVGNDVNRIAEAYEQAKSWARAPHRPPGWDGHTADRIADALAGSG